MNLTKRVAATAALLACLTASASAALFPEESSTFASPATVSTAPLNPVSALSMSAFEDFTNRQTITLTSGIVLPQAPLATTPAPAAKLVTPAQSSVTVPSSVNLVPAKPRAPLPAYMLRDYRKQAAETAASSR